MKKSTSREKESRTKRGKRGASFDTKGKRLLAVGPKPTKILTVLPHGIRVLRGNPGWGKKKIGTGKGGRKGGVAIAGTMFKLESRVKTEGEYQGKAKKKKKTLESRKKVYQNQAQHRKTIKKETSPKN